MVKIDAPPASRVAVALLAVAAASAAADAAVTVKGKDGTVQIDLPDGWAGTDPPANSAAAIQLVALNKALGIGVAVGVEDRSDITWTLDEYAKRSMDRVTKSPRFVDVSRTDLVPLMVNGKPAVQCEVRCAAGGIKLAYLYTYIETDKHFISVGAWSFRSKFERLKTNLSKLLDCVKETDPPADK